MAKNIAKILGAVLILVGVLGFTTVLQAEATLPVAISAHPTTVAQLTVHYSFLSARIGTPRTTSISRCVPM